MGIMVNISENSASQFFYEIAILGLFYYCTHSVFQFENAQKQKIICEVLPMTHKK